MCFVLCKIMKRLIFIGAVQLLAIGWGLRLLFEGADGRIRRARGFAKLQAEADYHRILIRGKRRDGSKIFTGARSARGDDEGVSNWICG